YGVTSGLWDLPVRPGDTGFAYGVLETGSGWDLFSLVAQLSELPSPSLSRRYGEIVGYLYSPDGTAAYGVKGAWNGPAVGTEGTWEAAIVWLDTGEAVGQMKGRYKDPGPYSHRVVGKYEGEWVICDRP